MSIKKNANASPTKKLSTSEVQLSQGVVPAAVTFEYEEENITEVDSNDSGKNPFDGKKTGYDATRINLLEERYHREIQALEERHAQEFQALAVEMLTLVHQGETHRLALCAEIDTLALANENLKEGILKAHEELLKLRQETRPAMDALLSPNVAAFPPALRRADKRIPSPLREPLLAAALRASKPGELFTKNISTFSGEIPVASYLSHETNEPTVNPLLETFDPTEDNHETVVHPQVAEEYEEELFTLEDQRLIEARKIVEEDLGMDLTPGIHKKKLSWWRT